MTNQEAIDILKCDISADKQGIEYCHDEVGIEALEMAIKALEQEPKILNTLDFAIDASNGDTNYFVGFRNGLRYAKSLIDGEEEPQFENCTEKVIRMRDATPEEQKLINNYIKSISRSTGVNFGTLEQESMTTMVYPQVEGITPTVVLDCDRNICIKNEYNGIGCDECEVTKSQEPTCDLISRQEVFDLFKTFWRCFASHTDEEIFKKEIAELPPVKQEPKTGHWIRLNDYTDEKDEHLCSNCGFESIGATRFCPDCGARMVKPDEGYANDWIGYSR